jgi:hypothetical protein
VPKLLLDGRVELEGPAGAVTVDARGARVALQFPTLRAAALAWRHWRRLPVRPMLDVTGLTVDVYIRGVRVRSFAPSA